MTLGNENELNGLLIQRRPEFVLSVCVRRFAVSRNPPLNTQAALYVKVFPLRNPHTSEKRTELS